MRLRVLPGVLRPPSDARLLAALMRERGAARDARVLDLFTGSGVLAIAAALGGAREVTAADISRRAVLNSRLNARLNGVELRVVKGDLFEPVAGERFELILANPPYVPAEIDAPPTRGRALAWDAGLDGRALLDPLCAQVAEHLAPGGTVLIVQSSLANEDGTLDQLGEAGLEAEIVARRHGPLGPIASARAEMLERRGLLGPRQRTEDLVVIRGARRLSPTSTPSREREART